MPKRSSAASLYPQALSRAVSMFSPWGKALLALLSLASIAAAHYAGFLIGLPPAIRDAVAERFASSFATVFALHVVIAVSLARIGTFLLFSLARLVNLAMMPLPTIQRTSKLRAQIRRDRLLNRLEPWFAAVLTLNGLVWGYLRLPKRVGLILIAVALVLVAITLISLRLQHFIKRTQGPRPYARKDFALACELLSVTAAALLCFSFVAGIFRLFNVALQDNEVAFATSCTSGSGALLATSGKDFLFMREFGKGIEVLLVGDGFALAAVAPDGPSRAIECEQGGKGGIEKTSPAQR